MKKVIKGETPYWALLCDCSEESMLICGVFASRREAKEANKGVKECPAKHYIKKCKVEIKLIK